MSGRKRAGAAAGPVTVRAIGLQSVEFTGPYYVLATIQWLGLRFMRSRHGGGWLVRQRDADDLMAALENDGRTVEVTL